MDKSDSPGGSKSFGTHDGTFHADEVTACALLLLFDRIDRNKVVRSRDSHELEKCEYVCDVGGVYDPALKRFDHHQVGYQGERSSAGMVLHYLKDEKVLDTKSYDFLNKSLVLGVDAHDNGRATLEIGVCTFSQVISNFTPIIYDASSEEQNAAFFAALDFAHGHLKRLFARYLYVEGCRQKVAGAMKSSAKMLIFDEPMPWMDLFFDMDGEKHPALFVIMPSGKHWKLRGIPPNSHDRMRVRKPLPESWAGLMNEELKKVSGISGAIFCHKGRFISVWETKEAALQALERAMR